jgi:hypothetical protein
MNDGFDFYCYDYNTSGAGTTVNLLLFGSATFVYSCFSLRNGKKVDLHVWA